jgi:HK97 family phage major capsid protein
MNKIYQMKQDRAKLVNQMREIMDRNEGQVMNADDQATYDRLEKEFDQLNDRINREEKQLARERQAAEAGGEGEDNGKPSDRMKLFAKALCGEPNDVAAYRNAAGDYTLGTDATAGALTAPMEFVEQLIQGLNDVLFMQNICHRTPSLGAAQSLGFPYRKTAASDAEWTTEVAESTAEQALQYGRREFKPNRMTKLIRLSRLLVAHSNLAPTAVLEEMQRVLAVTKEKAYMTGNGTGKPLGIFTASNDGIPTTRDIAAASATAVTTDDLLNVKYSLKGQYHPRAQWIMHRDLVKTIAKLKDKNDQYIWQPSTQAGQPDRLFGHAVNMSEYAPNTYTAGLYAAVLGDFQYYWIMDADELMLQVLKEKYATSNQVGYLFDYFGDGAPVCGEAFARLKMGAGT